MKSFIPIALISASFTIPMVHAQTATTTPVGYETLNTTVGVNYVGLRVHEPVLASGLLQGASSTTVTVENGITNALSSGSIYILEITSGSADVTGIITTITGFNETTDELTITDDLTSLSGFVGDESYQIRKSASIASVFGSNNESGLTSALTFAASDQVWLFNGAGFDKYYYAQGGFGSTEGWKDSAGNDVIPENINTIYTDAIILFSAEGNDVVVSGEIKTTSTQIAAVGQLNYFGGIYPVDSTLASAFGENNSSGLTSALTFAASDQIWIFNGASFDKYFYAQGGFGSTEGWKDSNSNDVDPTTINIPAGYVFINNDGDQNIPVAPPTSISDL